MFEFNKSNEEMENYPLNRFIQLCAEEPNNKVYRSCLEEEIKNVSKDLINDLSDDDIILMKTMIHLNYDIVHSDETNFDFDDAFKLRLESIKRIIDIVYEDRIKEDNKSGEQGEKND